MRSTVVLLAFAIGTAASAQETGDDFEDGGFNDLFWTFHVGVTVSPAAVHRGSYGMQLVLGPAPLPAYAQAALTGGDAGRAALRFWLRAAGGGGGLFPVGDIYGGAFAGNEVIAEVVAGYDGGVPFLEVGWSDGGIPYRSGNLTYLDTGWHLIELSVYGIGSSFGQAGLWMDGKQIDLGSAEDLSARTLTEVTVGPRIIYGAPTATDLFHFDDVRETNFGLPASTLVIQGPPNALANTCAPYPVALLTSSRVAASAPYPFDAHLGDALTVSSWYADMTCNSAAPVASFATGASSVATSIDDGVGIYQPTATATDFLGAEQTITFWATLPDAGATDAGLPLDAGGRLDGGPPVDGGAPVDGGQDGGASDAGGSGVRADLGCGCRTGGDFAALVVVLVVMLGSSMHRRSAGARPPA